MWSRRPFNLNHSCTEEPLRKADRSILIPSITCSKFTARVTNLSDFGLLWMLAMKQWPTLAFPLYPCTTQKSYASRVSQSSWLGSPGGGGLITLRYQMCQAPQARPGGRVSRSAPDHRYIWCNILFFSQVISTWCTIDTGGRTTDISLRNMEPQWRSIVYSE